MKFLYLLINFFTVIIPLLFSFHPKIKFYKTWKAFFAATTIVAIIFIFWDAIFTSLGVWSFNSDYLIGVFIHNLPVEEILFFICIPFSCVFTYHCLDKFYHLQWKPKTEKIFCIIFPLFLVTIGLIFRDKLYTSITCISTAITCVYIKFIAGVNWFGNVITVYLVCLIPFFIVNGLLTGTGLKAPVVLYNNSQNIGIRLLTIPIEDAVYGFELILLNIFFYNIFKSKFT